MAGEEIKVTTRTFTVKEGMKPQDVIKSPNATSMQKKMAIVFDADGITGYSAREAAVFNATTISAHENGSVSLWTTFANGTRKETIVKGDLNAIKYAPKGKLKNYAYKPGNPQTRQITKFEYTSPKIGENGIVTADTAFYPGTKTPKYISYYSSTDPAKKTESLKYEEEFTKDGKLKEFSKIWGFNKTYNQHEYVTYNNQGKAIEHNFETEDGFMYNHKEYPDGGYAVNHDDKKGRTLYYHRIEYKPKYTNIEHTHKYNQDGSYSSRIDDYYCGESVNEFNEYDKNDRLIRKKKLDSNDVVEYTVTPKYDKDGLVIKNDTIWNKEK